MVTPTDETVQGRLGSVSIDFRSDFGVILGSVLSAAVNAFNQGRA